MRKFVFIFVLMFFTSLFANDIDMKRAIYALEMAEESFSRKEFENAEWYYFVANCFFSESLTVNKKIQLRINLGEIYNMVIRENNPKLIEDNIEKIINLYID